MYVSTAGKWLFTVLYCIIVLEYTALSHLFGIYSCNAYSSDKLATKLNFGWYFDRFFLTLKWPALHILDKINKGVCCARSVIIYHVTIILSYSQVSRKTVIFYSILCSLWMFARSIIYKTKNFNRQILWFSLSYRYFNIWNDTESNQIPSYWQTMPVKELWNYINVYSIYILFFQ